MCLVVSVHNRWLSGRLLTNIFGIMDLLGKIKSLELKFLHRNIDVIKCTENENKLWNIFSSPATIKSGAKLVVDKTQIAALVSGGRLADIYGCGQHKLVASNMPIFATMKGWKYNHNSSFEAEVYFINTATFNNQNWTTLYPFPLEDDKLKSVAIETSGTYSFCVKPNPSAFIENLIKDQEVDSQERWFNNFIIRRFRSYLETSGVDLLGIVKEPQNFSDKLMLSLKNDLLDYDIVLYDFQIDKFIVYKN
ncbi:hypothetical protein CCYN2B_280028 [Capnocytophaga cynodegmi]|uniref:SPFH domain-containing protein n=1 Tax=Capnocytophaga cynodegmi TaxID=28189 RepID=A0A0B7H8S9_9FLAO|nr:hypothetical protein CCYN2B_280028 [Capnocytophaga cynodegmi]